MGIGSALQTLFKEWFVAGWLRNKGEASSSTGTVHAATPVPVLAFLYHLISAHRAGYKPTRPPVEPLFEIKTVSEGI